jgi:phytoene dehydrogenase-like protein
MPCCRRRSARRDAQADAVTTDLAYGATALDPARDGTFELPGERAAALPQRWGAFTTYLGLPAGLVSDELALHHQVVTDPSAPLGEGNSVFISFSPPGDRSRSREGGRAVTLSTHTDVAGWERAAGGGHLEARTADYASRLRAAFDRVAPGAWAAARLIDCGTPLTFARYTGRWRGLCGGVPQTVAHANLRALSHVSGIPGLVLAGDTTFPGQSTVGAALSGLAAARSVCPRSVREISSGP